MTSANEPKKEGDQGHARGSPRVAQRKAVFDFRQWKQRTSVWLSGACQRLGSYLKIVFSFKRDGNDVPIAIALFIAVVPFYLLWQQNKLAYRQEQIVRVQTNANTLTANRQIAIDINNAEGVRHKFSAIITAYKLLGDIPVNVSFYKGDPDNKVTGPFSISIPIKGFIPEPCAVKVPAKLPLADFDMSACEASEPIKILKDQTDLLFRPDGFGWVALSLVNYLKLVADTQQITLAGASTSAPTLPDIIKEAIEFCNLNSANEKLTEDPNRTQGRAITMTSIEKAAQNLGHVYASEHLNPNFNNQSANRSKKVELLGDLERSLGLLLISNAAGPQTGRYHLHSVLHTIAHEYNTLSDFVQKAKNVCDEVVLSKLHEREDMVLHLD